MNQNSKAVLPLILLFIILNGLFLTTRSLLTRYNIDRDIVLIANLLFFGISLAAFFMQRKALMKKNPHAFVRAVMGGMMIRMVIAVVAMVIYLTLAGNAVNKPGVFISMFLYILYLVVEVGIMMKLNRKPDA